MRLLGLKMTKSTIIVKYVSTVHPHYRDGLLKGVNDREESEELFHVSPHRYYECRPMECVEGIIYELEEQEEDYWDDLSFAEFWSMYDIVYGNFKTKNERPKKHFSTM